MKVTIETSDTHYTVKVEVSGKTYEQVNELTNYGAKQFSGVNFEDEDMDDELYYALSDISSAAFGLAKWSQEWEEEASES